MDIISCAYLILRNIPHRDWSVRIDQRHQVLGRSRDAEIWIPARFSSVSRQHAETWVEKNSVWFRDLGSRYGTAVNGVWIDGVDRVAIRVGDTIWLGGAELQLVSEVETLAEVVRAAKSVEEGTERPTQPPPFRYMAQLLSRAEIDVMLWISRGYTDYDEIGRRLHRSPHTVRTEIEHICRKLQLHSRRGILELLEREQHYDQSCGKWTEAGASARKRPWS